MRRILGLTAALAVVLAATAATAASSGTPAPIAAATPSGKPTSTATATPSAPKAPESALVAKKISLDVKGMSLDKVLTAISAASGFKMAVDPDVSGDIGKVVVTLKVRDISVRSALELATFGTDFTFVEDAGSVLILSRAKRLTRVESMVLALDDIVQNATQATEIATAIRLAVNHKVDPDVAPWTAEGGAASLGYQGGRLTVKQTPRGFERIDELLTQLRIILINKEGADGSDAVEAAESRLNRYWQDHSSKERSLLYKQIDLDLVKVPIMDVLGIISEKLGGANIVIDPTRKEGGSDDFKNPFVDLKVSKTSAESVMRLIMGTELACSGHSDYILMANPKRLPENAITTMVHPCPFGDATSGGAKGATSKNTDAATAALLGQIRSNVRAEKDPLVAAWTAAGGPASLTQFRGAMIVTQSSRGQQMVLAYWNDARKKASGLPDKAPAGPKAATDTQPQLSQKIDVDFKQTSLMDILKQIAKDHKGLNIVISPDIAAAGKDLATVMVTVNLKAATIEEVLNRILGKEFGFVAYPSYIMITTKQMAGLRGGP